MAPEDLELVKTTLAWFSPEDREHIIRAVQLVSQMPAPVAARFLAGLAARSQLQAGARRAILGPWGI